MEKIPLDLWTIIRKYIGFQSKLNLKQTHKQFIDLFVFDNKYVSQMQKHIRRHLNRNDVTFNDIIKHTIQQNNANIINMINLIGNIKTKKSIISNNCVHIPYLMLSDSSHNDVLYCVWNDSCSKCDEIIHNHVRCSLCNIEYECSVCRDISIESDCIEYGIPIAFNYIKIQCHECKQYIMALMCSKCNKLPNDCYCKNIDDSTESDMSDSNE